MSSPKRRLSWVSALLLAFSLPLAAQPQNSAPAQTDEAALRALLNELFATYPKEDLAGHLRHWSAQSPALAAHRKMVEGIFANNERIEIKNLAVRRLTLEGVQAEALVEFDLSTLSARTGRPIANEGKLYRTLRFVKETDVWKAWDDKPAESLLALKLWAAPTTAWRSALLAAEKDWLTASILAREAGYLLGEGKHQQALTLAQLAQQLAEQNGDKPGLANVLDKIGEVYNSRGNYSAAAEAFKQSLKLREELGEPRSIAIAQNNLGSLYRLLGNYRRAHELLQKCLQTCVRLDSQVLRWRVLLNLGNLYRAQGNYELALSYYQESLQGSDAMRDKLVIATTWNNIGTIYRAQNQLELARAAYQKSLELYEASKNITGMATALHNLSNVYRYQGKHAEALQYLEQARATYQESLELYEASKNITGMATALHNLGNVYRYQGKYAEALQYLQRALGIRQRSQNQAHIASSLISIGEVHYASGQYAQALTLHEQASTLARQIGDPELLLAARMKAGQAQLAAQQPAAARQAFSEAITTIESLREQVAGDEQEQQRFFENKLDPYYAMVKLLLAENRDAEALSYAERARGRVLLDVLHSGRVKITKAMTAAEQEQERSLEARLSSLNVQLASASQRQPLDQARLADLKAQLQKARLEAEVFQTNLYVAHPELKTQRGQAQPLTLAEAGALLPDARTALLEFVVTAEQSFLFVLTKAATGQQSTTETAQLKVFPLATREPALAERVAQLRRHIAEREPGFAGHASALYQLLLAPARALLQDKTTLVIVPDGPLWELPFQALMPAANRFLIEEAAIFYAPSLTVLREMTKLRRQLRTTASPTLLALGNPLLGQPAPAPIQASLMDEPLAPLPDAERQVNEIARLYGRSASKVYLGAAASEARLKAEAARYRVLHLATHGILDDRSPLYSHLLLAPRGETEDGFLEAREIMKLDLQAELAVLSACETARGRVSAGEGVIGLTWALFVAGCPTTVVSQWKVRADSTADLMVAFHRQLRLRPTSSTARPSTAAALRQAALKLMTHSQYRHPFYWAGFVVVGDGF